MIRKCVEGHAFRKAEDSRVKQILEMKVQEGEGKEYRTRNSVRTQNGKDWETKEQDDGRIEENDEG